MTNKLALLSVSNKAGITVLGRALVEAGYTILSTGGTARALAEGGVPVTMVSEFTGAAEMMNGRVKTLHPLIHGGILGDRVAHAGEADPHGVTWIDVVAVNLYPFEETIAAEPDLATAVEHIDIGGPTMVRAAAKNHRSVLVVVDPQDYPRVIGALEDEADTTALRAELAIKAFRHTARYDAIISDWLGQYRGEQSFPEERGVGLKKVQELRYGENPHQTAAFYSDWQTTGRSLARIVQHQGKELSFNNLGDLDGALRVVYEFERPGCAIIKHMN